MVRKRRGKSWNLVFKQAVSKARTLIKDPNALGRILEEAFAKANKHGQALHEVIEDLKVIFRMIKAWISGDYKDVSIETIVLLVGAIIYFLMPVDAIPDFIPVIGYMDDVAVLVWVMTSVKSDLERFRTWESARAS